MSYNFPLSSFPSDQDVGNPYDLSPASAHSPAARLGDFSSIFDQCFAPNNDAVKAVGSDPSSIAPPGSPRKAALPLLQSFSPDASSRAARELPYKGGLLNGLDLSTIASPRGSASSTPVLQDTVSEGDDGDSDSDDADIDVVRLSQDGLFAAGDIGRHHPGKVDAQWPYGSGVDIASASTSPATAISTSAARAAAVRSVVDASLFSNQLTSIENAAMLSRPAYAGQPSPMPIPTSPNNRQSPRRIKRAPTPHHRKSVPEKLELVRGQLHQEFKLDQEMKRTVAEASRPIHVIVDMSNIFIGFVDKAKTRYKLAGRGHFIPFSFEALTEILVRGRSHARLAAAGSVKGSDSRRPDYMNEAQSLGFDMSILERIKKQDSDVPTPYAAYNSFREQAVDEVLHLKICVSVLDYDAATLVLATGDAKEAEFSDGFLNHVKRALKKGWCVELYSWKSNISRAWTNLQREQTVPNQFRIIELDRYLDYLVGPNPGF